MIRPITVALILFTLATAIAGQADRKLVRVVQNGEVKDEQVYDYNGSYALVIGQTAYQDPGWGPLPGAKTDAEEVRKVLLEHDFVVDLHLDLPSSQLKSVIENWVDKHGYGGRKRLVLYFAGHGHTMRVSDGRDPGYIVPIDAPNPNKSEESKILFQQKALNMSTLKDFASRMTTRHSLFVFDSCFSGAITRAAGGSRPPVIELKLSQDTRQFITAGTDGQTVPDVSIFRKYFVEGLRGAADIERDGFITARELFEFLSDRVINASNKQQTPTYGKIDFNNARFGDMVFPLAVDIANTTEDVSWKAAQERDTIADYNIFLTSYPNSKKSNLATTRLVELGKKEEAARKAASPSTESPKSSMAVDPILRTVAIVPRPFEFKTRGTDGSGILSATASNSRESIVEDLGGGIILRLASIPAGTFKMGGNDANEKPTRQVNVGAFYMSIYEVTREQWLAVANLPMISVELDKKLASGSGSEKLPVSSITWEEAREFCERLNRKTGRRYGLPSEAEWEYAARAGKTTMFAFGPRIVAELANYNAAVESLDGVKGVARSGPIAVGDLGYANEWGLYDMHGNVAEWCEDGYLRSYDKAGSTADPRLADGDKVIRGGHYKSVASKVCSACRAPGGPADPTIGFRIVMRTPIAAPAP